MKTKLVNNLISIIFILGILGAGNLAYNEFLVEGTCPKLGIIPACYIVLVCFVVPFITHIFNKSKVLYFLFTVFALVLAIYATIGELLGNLRCPKTDGGLPMCYLSLVIFTILILLKIFSLKNKS